MPNRRVVVTGMGVVSPVGNDIESFWSNLVRGISGIKKLTRFDCSDLPTKVAGEVQDYNPSRYIDEKESRRLDRYAQFALDAAFQAVNQSELNFENEDPYKSQIYIGTATAGQGWALEQSEVFKNKGYRRMNPFTAASTFPNAASSVISIQFGTKGRTDTISSGCASSLNAIGHGYDAIVTHDADICIVGGSEAPLYAPIFGSYLAARVTSIRNGFPVTTPRPFDQERDGIILSEGAGILCLESLEHAISRGATVYAEILGLGCTSDAFKMIAHDPSGNEIAKAMGLAIASSKLKPSDIDYVHLHGMGDKIVDKIETDAVKSLFGEHAYKLKTSAIKSMTGHAQGACGALELIATILSINHKIVLPTINLTKPDPECDLDYTPNTATPYEINNALVNTVGFGGKNSSVVVSKFVD